MTEGQANEMLEQLKAINKTLILIGEVIERGQHIGPYVSKFRPGHQADTDSSRPRHQGTEPLREA